MKHPIEIPSGWDIGGNTNGGFLMGLALEHMITASGRDCALSLTAHFLRPVSCGAGCVVTEVIKEGRMLATVGAELWFGDKPALRLIGAFGDEPRAEDAAQFTAGEPPQLPPLDQCVPAWVPPPGRPLFSHLELRRDPASQSMLSGKPAGKGHVECWISPPDQAERATLNDLPLLADGFPPPVFDLNLPVNWVPTVELTVHTRGVPAAGWLRGRVQTRFVQYGLLEEDVELWDSQGQLVAQSRQLALVPRPRPE